MDNSLVC